MTKTEFVALVAEKNPELPKKSVEKIMTDTFDAITQNLIAGEKTAWPGFGGFETKTNAARKGRNPATGAAINIDASKSAKFKPSTSLKASLNG